MPLLLPLLVFELFSLLFFFSLCRQFPGGGNFNSKVCRVGGVNGLLAQAPPPEQRVLGSSVERGGRRDGFHLGEGESDPREDHQPVDEDDQIRRRRYILVGKSHVQLGCNLYNFRSAICMEEVVDYFVEGSK